MPNRARPQLARSAPARAGRHGPPRPARDREPAGRWADRDQYGNPCVPFITLPSLIGTIRLETRCLLNMTAMKGFASKACCDGSLPSECSRGPCGPWRRQATPRRVERGERAQGLRLHSEPDVRRTFEAKPSARVTVSV